MQNLSINVLASYMVSISAVSLILVQVVKTLLINRVPLDDTARLALIQLVNYVVNFGLLMLVLAISNAYAPGDFIFYLAAPLAGVGGSSTAFNFITSTHSAQSSNQTSNQNQGQKEQT